MIDWFARNGVAANLLMMVFVIGGTVSLLHVKRELFPQFSLDTVTVTVPYPGATPEEVEEAIIIRIEEAIEGLDGIKEIQSSAFENLGMVVISVDKGYSLSKVKEQVKTRVDAISAFPVESERPIIDEVVIQRDTIWVAVYGDTDERSLKEYAERARQEIADLSGVSQALIWGSRPYEVSIEVSEHTLRAYQLSFDEVVAAVRRSSLDIPGGIIRSSEGEILVRTKEQVYTGLEFEGIVVRQSPDGSRIRLGDLAVVKDTFAEEQVVTRFNGRPATFVMVREVGRENPLAISKAVYEWVDQARKQWVPHGVEIAAWGDASYYLKGRLDLMVNNGIIGFILVTLALALFLRPSLAVFVAIGIPACFLATFAIAPFIGLSINLISLFAFILVLGIVVDDAIVVGESVFTQYQTEGPGLESAIKGTHLVSTPVTFAVLTTVVAFIPVFFLPGLIGKFFFSVPLVVIPTLLFSLVQSKLVLPYHLSLCRVGDRKSRDRLDPLSKLQRRFTDGLESFTKNQYARCVRVSIRYRYLVGSLFLGVFILSISMVKAGWVRYVQFPDVPHDFILVSLEMPAGTPIEDTCELMSRMETSLEEIAGEVEAETGFNPVLHVGFFAGYDIVAGGMIDSMTSSSHLATIIVELAKSEIRDSSSFELSRLWRERIGEVPEVRRLVINASASGPVGLPIDIQLAGQDFDQLKAASRTIQERLQHFEGIYDIRDTYSEGKREIKVRMRPDAEALGVSAGMVGSQVRQAFYGAEAQRIQRGQHEVRVMVRYPVEERRSVANLRNLRLRTPDGREVPVEEVAELDSGYGYPVIRRHDGKRVINIQADANKTLANTTDINKELYDEILPEILRSYPGVTLLKAGEAKDFEELLPSLISGMLMVLVMIYALLAIPFKSYLQPVIVMFVVPFGIAGAILGHFVTGQDLSILSMLGIIALTGVVVNGSLVLVDYINRLREAGVDMHDAVWQGGVARFRPILLTSITTFAGLTPILLERTLQAQFLIPMATSLSFGVAFSTLITLILVPCSYLMLEDLGRINDWIFGRWWRGLRQGISRDRK